MQSVRLQLLFVIDPLEVLILETETSLLLIREARRRGHVPSIVYLRDLWLQGGEARVRARTIAVDETARPFFQLGPPRELAAEDFDLVLMRKDPPIDSAYVNGLAILQAARDVVPVINDPVGLLRSNEKLLPLAIPGAAPPTVVTADPEVAARFAREHEEVVVKPLNEFSGHGISRLSIRVTSLDAEAVGALAAHQGQHVVLQRFLPEVEQGDKRVIVVEGEPVGWVNRVPQPGSFRANIHQGARVEPTELTERERELIVHAGPVLAERGLDLAGFDFIGGYLTEINVTSPSAVRQINQVMGIRLEERLVDWLERRAAEGVRVPLPC